MLIFIYYFKSVLAFNDIETLFAPITSRHFSGSTGTSKLSLEDIYREVFTLEDGEMKNLKADAAAKFERAMETFKDAPVTGEERDYLQLFSFICELSFDVYLKKLLIEKLCDSISEEKSICPGVSRIVIWVSLYSKCACLEKIVIPRCLSWLS